MVEEEVNFQNVEILELTTTPKHQQQQKTRVAR